MDFHSQVQQQGQMPLVFIFTYISDRPFLTLFYNLTLSAFESQFLNFIELVLVNILFIRLISLSSFHFHMLKQSDVVVEDVKWFKFFKFKMKVYFKNKLGVNSTVELEKNNTMEEFVSKIQDYGGV